MTKFDFSGKKILVTGASSGLGRATAVLLSQTGAKLVLMARREKELQNTLQMLKGTGHSYIVCDMAKFDDVIRAIKMNVTSDGRKYNHVVHCAGSVQTAPLRGLTQDILDTMIHTNFYSFAAILKCASSKRLFDDGGTVIGVSSGVARYGQKGNGAYGASKAAMNSLALTAVREFAARKIKVKILSSGAICTEMWEKISSISTLPPFVDGDIQGFMSPMQVANVIAVLLSEEVACLSETILDIGQAKEGCE